MGDNVLMMTTPLLGSVDREAYYYLSVFVGVPPQRQSVILDSGSSTFAFPCKDCAQCGSHLDPGYDPGASNVSSWLKCEDSKCHSNRCSSKGVCQYHQAYSEGSSIQGSYFSDLLSLTAYVSDSYSETNSSKQLSTRFDYIGCHDKETKLFTTQLANGIMGVSYPKHGVQPTALDALFSNSAYKKAVSRKVLALCISDEGGIMTIGGVDSSYLKQVRVKEGLYAIPEGGSNGFSSIPTMRDDKKVGREGVEAKIVSNSSYDIKGTSLHVHRRVRNPGSVLQWRSSAEDIENPREYESAPISGSLGKETILDSGTTFSYVPSSLYRSIEEELDQHCIDYRDCSGHDRTLTDICVDLPQSMKREDILDILDANFPHFEIITSKKTGRGLPWMPRSYFYKRESMRGRWCVGIDDNRSEETVLGMTFFKNAMVVLDRDRGMTQVIPGLECPEFVLKNRDALSVQPSADFYYDSATTVPPLKVNNVVPIAQKFNPLSKSQSSSPLIVYIFSGAARLLFTLGFARVLYLRYQSKVSTVGTTLESAFTLSGTRPDNEAVDEPLTPPGEVELTFA